MSSNRSDLLNKECTPFEVRKWASDAFWNDGGMVVTPSGDRIFYEVNFIGSMPALGKFIPQTKPAYVWVEAK
jgi:hypothetical protein